LDKARKEALDATLDSIVKRFGEMSIMRLGDARHLAVEAIPTGSLSLDIALGIGGIPRGRVTEIYGPESSGKTTISQHIIAEAQKMGGTAAFIDMEHALDPVYAANCGVDTEKLLVSQPDTGEMALEITESLCSGNRLGSSAGAKSGNRRGYGRCPYGADGTPDVAGAAEIIRRDQADEHDGDFYQPAAQENRCDVREPGDDHGRHGAEILRIGKAGRAAHSGDQGRAGNHRQPYPGARGKKQSRRTVSHG